jgi:hypothetical protein
MNCILESFVDGKIEVKIRVTGRRGKRRKELRKEKILEFEKEALGCILWRPRF